MEEPSHMNVITTALLQTCGYVIDQMQTEVTIDVNKFFEAFSIKGESQSIRPPSWTKTDSNSVLIKPNILPSSISPDPPFDMDDYRQCRQAEALRWIDLQEKRASIISRLQPVSAEEYQKLRNEISSKTGPLLRKQKRKIGMKYSYHIVSINYLLNNI